MKPRNDKDGVVEAKFVEDYNESRRSRLEKPLDLSREVARKQALELFKHTRTCGLALELCLLIRTHRATLEKQDVHDCCNLVSKLCEESGCQEASKLCAEAAEAVLGNEKMYLEFCEQSLRKCNESRQPRKRSPERATYVS